jgi:hypothetical protein
VTPYFITVRLDAERTRDFTIRARNTWHARWLFAKTHPMHALSIITVRPGRGS